MLLILALGVSACLPGVRVVRPEEELSPLPPPTVAPMAHNVAIMGIDFDPPLSADAELQNGVTLLVAVANQGLSMEPVVNVTARLLDPLLAGIGDDLQRETVLLRDLAPAEVRIVRLATVNALPRRNHYQLVIEIAPLAGEEDLRDNVQTYDVLIGEAD
ncbi:MAG: hypothetical protein BWY52_01034 [Chloroflexi bacterium ADurb.Bin325]|nr:MAG: hypothetical protein BWY52_01034 [Chloroflexi bacterium ADurb.Bin325]